MYSVSGASQPLLDWTTLRALEDILQTCDFSAFPWKTNRLNVSGDVILSIANKCVKTVGRRIKDSDFVECSHTLAGGEGACCPHVLRKNPVCALGLSGLELAL